MRNLKKSKKWDLFWWIINFFLLDSPYERYQKVKKCQTFHFDECSIFLCATFYLRNIMYLPKLLRDLLINKNGTLQFWKVNNSIATKLGMTLLKNRKKLKLVLVHDTIQWLNCVGHYLNVKKTENWLRKLMHNFVVHSNESACNKSGRLGLDQVLKWWSSYRSSE